jgi:hypothetical protein
MGGCDGRLRVWLACGRRHGGAGDAEADLCDLPSLRPLETVRSRPTAVVGRRAPTQPALTLIARMSEPDNGDSCRCIDSLFGCLTPVWLALPIGIVVFVCVGILSRAVTSVPLMRFLTVKRELLDSGHPGPAGGRCRGGHGRGQHPGHP